VLEVIALAEGRVFAPIVHGGSDAQVVHASSACRERKCGFGYVFYTTESEAIAAYEED
jgi:hypothetical protein